MDTSLRRNLPENDIAIRGTPLQADTSRNMGQGPPPHPPGLAVAQGVDKPCTMQGEYSEKGVGQI